MTEPVKSRMAEGRGISLPGLGFGTWRFGGAMEADYSRDAEDIAAIRRAFEAGIRHFDTAEMYGAGHAEELLAQALAGVSRNSLFLTGKVWKSNLTYERVWRSCEASLKRLGTDYLDLYLIHQVDESVDLAETLAALNRLVAEKMVRQIGVSNFATERLRRARALSAAPIAVNQVHYSLAVRAPERSGLLRYCQRNGITLMAYRPVRGVDLQTPLLAEVAARYRVTPAAAALNWLISQPGVVTMVATHTPEHLAQDMAATGWRMSMDDIELLREGFPQQHELPSVALT